MLNFKIFLVLGINLIAFGLLSQVANDNCTSAQAITIPASGSVCITSTTVNAISDNTTSSCDTGTPGNEVWFTFIATGSQNTVTVTPQGSPSIQQAIVAIDGTGCADNAFNICNASATNNGTATATWTFTPGTQVWISVESNNGTQGGFQLCVTSTTPPPTPGSSCNTATPLCNLNNFTLNPFPANNNSFTPQCFIDPLQQPVFYKFTVGQTGTLQWTADVQGTAEYDWALYNITGGCPSNSTTPIACNYEYANGNSNIIGMQPGPGTCSGEFCDPVTVTAGQTYMLIIDNYNNNTSGFIMSFAGSTFLMAPTAQFTVSPSTACGSANVTITNTSVAASSYNWNFGNGNTSTLQNPPAQNYTTPGTYLISLTTNSLAGCTNTTSQSVTVNANHTITAGADRTVCVNLPMSSISMTLGGGANGASATGLPTGVNATVSGGVVTISGTPTVAGTYNYTVTTSGNSCATATATGIITVIAIPTPTITTNAATCSSAGSATIGNYDPSLTYSFTPSGPTVGSGGLISGLSAGTNYTVIASNGTCNSTASSTFNVSAQLTTPAVPTITTNPATCSAAGTASISNYGGALTYTFSPSGPTAGASGAISNMTTGTSYTVTAGNGSCTSAPSSAFLIDPQLTTPAVPSITTNPATCSAAGTASISNYGATLTYTFSPSGPTAGASGAISNMTTGTSYTVTAGNGSCTSAPSSAFLIDAQLTTPAVPTITTNPATCSSAGTASISNYGGTLTYTFSPSGPTAGASGAISNMTTGTSYTVTAGNGSCTSAPSSAFLIDPQLSTPAVPTITTNPATCSAAGTASISNYGGTLTYTFSPSGPTAGASGAISNMTTGTSYTVTASIGSCTSAPSSAFLIDPQLTTPAVPTITTNPATCFAAGTASISNYGGTLTYTFSPSGPTAGASGAISNMTTGTSYTVTAGNGSCTSAPSSAFLIDPQLSTPAVPTVTTLLATCASNGTATVSNYVSTLIYTFNPVGPTVGSGGVISGMTAGTNYTLIAGNGSCSSAPSSSFNVSSQLTAPAVPTITTNAATCAATGNASVSNFDGAVTYTFTPSGPSVNATGLISGMNPGSNYTLTAGNANCTSSPSSAFNIAAQLITPAAPVISVISPSCSANGSASITNYVSSQTYSFTPSGPSVGTTGSISNLTPSVSYTVTTNNGSCTSLASQAFTIQSQLIAPAIPTTTTNPATCTGPGTANIGNYDGSLTYTFTPSGPSVGAGGTISGMNPGSNYTVIASNTNCPSLPSASFNIAAQLPTPATPTISTSPATCFANGSATITNFIGSQTYTFTPAGPSVGSNGSISGMIPGTNYTVITNNGSCSSSASSSFSIQNQIVFPAIPFQADTLIGCAPFSVILSAANFPGVQYNWSSNGNSIGSGSTLSSVFTEAGCFDINLTVTNSQGCTASTTVNDFICVEANPIVSFTSSPNVFVDNSHNVNFSNNTIGATEYYWDFGDQSSSTENNPSHLYSNIQSGMLVTLTASSALGCTSQSTIFINYKEQSLFYVPNSFTPDQDEFNQTWGPVFTQGFDPFNFDLYVFNRWGEIIWESHDSQGRWDGTYGNKGRECADGVYTWKISYKPKETDEKIDITGSIRLIR
jgi:gliding motility-associated-like protein